MPTILRDGGDTEAATAALSKAAMIESASAGGRSLATSAPEIANALWSGSKLTMKPSRSI